MKNRRIIFRVCKGLLKAGNLFAALGLFFFILCSTYPVAPPSSNLLEFESVWQYLKTYSIWQDSLPLPPNAFTYSSPEKLLASTNDTLHHVLYTKYRDTINAALYNTAASGYGNAGVPISETFSTPSSGPTVFFDSITAKTAYLQIIEFVKDSTYAQFLKVLPSLSRFSNIMIDLRQNGGGEISTVDSILSYFLLQGTTYIIATYRDYDKNTRTAMTKYNERWSVKQNHPLTLVGKNVVILMNRGSASASEMMAAGLKDGRANSNASTVTIVGDTSYGKGIGQIVINRQLFGKRDVQITFLRFKRACGCADSIYHRKGIVPDLLVVNPSNTAIADTMQLSAAFHIFEPTVRVKWFTSPLAKRGFYHEAEFSAIGASEFEH